MRFGQITVAVADYIAVVTLDRPPVNAVDLVMYRQIRDLFVDIDQIGPGVRAVVLTGAGRHFCAAPCRKATASGHVRPGAMTGCAPPRRPR